MIEYVGKTATGGDHYKAMQFPPKEEDPFMDKASAALREVSDEAPRKYGHGRDNLRQRQQMISAEGDKQLAAAKRELSGDAQKRAIDRLNSMLNTLIRTA